MPRLKNKFILSLPVLLLLLSISCSDPATVYRQFVDIPEGEWQQQVYCEFNTAQADSALFMDRAARYDLIVAMRVTDNYPYSDIYIGLDSDSQADIPEELHMTLTDKHGWKSGAGTHGVYVVTDTIARGIALPPMFSISIFQKMNRDILPGVLSLGIIINKVTE